MEKMPVTCRTAPYACHGIRQTSDAAFRFKINRSSQFASHPSCLVSLSHWLPLSSPKCTCGNLVAALSKLLAKRSHTLLATVCKTL